MKTTFGRAVVGGGAQAPKARRDGRANTTRQVVAKSAPIQNVAAGPRRSQAQLATTLAASMATPLTRLNMP